MTSNNSSTSIKTLCDALENNTLRTINLQGQPCTDDDAWAIAKRLVVVAQGNDHHNNTSSSSLSRLTTIQMSANSFVSNDGFVCLCDEGLQRSPCIRQLCINGGHLNPTKAAALGRVLTNNANITILRIARCTISSQQAATELAHGLANNQGLVELSLCNNDWTSVACIESILRRGLLSSCRQSNLERLSIDGESMFCQSNNETMIRLCTVLSERRNRSIRYVEFHNMPLTCTEAKSALASSLIRNNTTIEDLRLVRMALNDDGAQLVGDALKANTTLQRLTLDHNNITDEGIVVGLLQQQRQHNTTTTTTTTNATTTALTQLSLAYNSISTRGVIELSKALVGQSSLSRLRSLSLEGNAAIGYHGIRAIATSTIPNNCTLRQLNLRGTCNDDNDDSGNDSTNQQQQQHRVREVICNALENNYSLVSVLVGDGRRRYARRLLQQRRGDDDDVVGIMDTKITNHLQRNRILTENVLRETNLPASLWPHVIEQYTNNNNNKPNHLYFLLRQRVDLFHITNTQTRQGHTANKTATSNSPRD